jgi:two-component system phosphate regulon sensor histidine kinase PhoR
MAEPSRLALQMTLIISGFYLIGLAFIFAISTIEIAILIVLFFIFTGFTFFIIRLYTENYIYEKIKVIYKTIHQQKRFKSKVSNLKQKQFPSIDHVQDEVVSWSHDSQEQIEELQKLELYRKEYIGNISHELKTPLFNIQGYISTLIDGGLKDENINIKYLERSEKSVERLIRIVDELDTISSLEAGNLKLNKSRFNILDLVHEVFDFHELKAQSKNCQLLISRHYPTPIEVYADRVQIQTLLNNLISNAIKYGDPSNGKVKLSFFHMDKNILIEVTDNGPGMEKEELNRIFERFYRTDKARSRDTGGSGLGLAIVKHILNAHEQVINVRSTPGLGSTFAFTLEKA